MQSAQLIGIIAGTFTGVSLLPQLIKIKKEKKANGMSAGMLIVLMAGLICWVVYGILRNDYPVIITNSFSFVINIWIICLSIKYKRQEAHKQST